METIERPGSGEIGLAAVREEIASACREAGRDPFSVTLVAVSKTFGAEAIAPVITAGQRVFGENRVQEAKAKWPPLLAQNPALELHLIGPLQSNKAREAVALFDAVHSLDRESLAEALSKEIAKGGRAAAGDGWLCRALPRHLRARNLRADVHSAAQRNPHPALCPDRQNRPSQRAEIAVDGHECRFPERNRVWRDACADWQRHFRFSAAPSRLNAAP